MERAAWVALSTVTGLGPARFRRLLDRFGSASAALAVDPDEVRRELDLSPEAAAQIADFARDLDRLSDEIASLDEQGVTPLIWEDDEYPPRLLATSSPPSVLWRAGPADPCCPGGALAVIGSREVAEESLAFAREFAAEAGRAGIAVISGLAAGIDAAAHEGALGANAVTIGVCGCGLMTALTRGRDGLAGAVVEAGGLCSELMPTAPLTPQSLFSRDRIIAGLAQATIVVEARADGGAVHTANLARREGRPVLVVKWPTDHSSTGNRQLISGGGLSVPAEEGPAAALAAAMKAVPEAVPKAVPKAVSDD